MPVLSMYVHLNMCRVAYFVGDCLDLEPLAKLDLQYSVVAVFVGKTLNFRGHAIDVNSDGQNVGQIETVHS
eukprot:3154322-Pleurochrysis_carterae.AAC.4